MTREEGLQFIGKSIKDDVDMAMVADAIEALSAEPCEKTQMVDTSTFNQEENSTKINQDFNQEPCEDCCNGDQIEKAKLCQRSYLAGMEHRLEPKTGHWIGYDTDSDRYNDIKCSNCGKRFTVDADRFCDIGFVQEDLYYCPNCGAKMSEIPTGSESEG